MDYAAALANIDKRRRGAEFFEMAGRMAPILLEMAKFQPPAMHEKVVELAILYAEVAAAWHDHSLVRSVNEVHKPELQVTLTELPKWRPQVILEEPSTEADWQEVADLPSSKGKPGWPKGKPRKVPTEL